MGPVSAGFPTNAAYMGAYEANSAAPFYNIYNNGTRKVNSTAAFTFQDNLNALNTAQSSTAKMTGQIGEVIALDYVPSTETRQRIEGYLAHKWGLQASLPVDHSFKSAAPGPPALASLVGTASDADGTPLTTIWTLVSGPQVVVIANPSALSTQVEFISPGTYTFKLMASDGNDQVSSQCVITVSALGTDNDGDSMEDGWELAHFGGTAISNGTADNDGDGFTDQQEYRCGTDPKDSASLLKTVSLTKATANEMVLTFNAVAGKTYKVLASRDLTESSWQPIQTGIIGVSPTTSVTVPIDGNTMFFIIGVE